jgi:hypothetical protein
MAAWEAGEAAEPISIPTVVVVVAVVLVATESLSLTATLL